MQEPFVLDPDSLTVETFDPTDPANDPSQVLIVSTDDIFACGTKMSVVDPG